MGVSRYIGRVGALAVVLGVGSVVAFPQTALADDGDGSSGSVSASSQQSTAGDPGTTGTATAGTGTDVEPPKVTTAESPANTTTTGSQDPDDGVPASTVSAQTNTGSSTSTITPTEPSSAPVPVPEPASEPVEIVVEPPATDASPEPAKATAAETPSTTSNDAPAPAAVAIPALSGPSPSVADRTVAESSRSIQMTASAPQPSTSRVQSLAQPETFAVTTAALAPAAPALDPLSALLAVPVSIITTLINAVLTPFFGGVPTSPAQPSLLWAVLGWVRREFQRTFTNSTPTAPNQAVTVSLALPDAVSAPVAFGATDADGDALTYTVPGRGTVGGPSHGTVTIDQATGTFTYDPDDAYALTGGTDTFTYTVSDAGARPAFFGIPLSFSPTSATGTVAVTLNRVNVAPVINGDDTATLEDTPVTIAVLGNDTDANGNPLAVTGVTQATNGTTTFTASGVTYTPNANYSGTDSFTYTATDGSLAGTATVTVTVTAVDDSPGAVSDTATVAEDSGTTLIDVLANDTDVDGNATITGVTQSTNGTVTFTGTTLSYTPNANFNGTDTFTYTVNGGSTATATITVTSVNDAPVAIGDNATVAEDGGATLIDVLANDTDVDAGPKTITGATQPTGGTVTFTGTTVRYTPKANYNGTDTFTYTLTGGSTATVTVTVTPVNDAPVLGQVSSTPGLGNTWVVSTNASDIDGDVLTTTVMSTNATPLTVTQLPGGNLQVTVDPTWASAHPGAQVPVTVTVTDTENATATTTLAIGTVNNVIGLGANPYGQLNIPALPAGITYTQVASGLRHTVLLRSDGTAVAVGSSADGALNIPQLPDGVTYTRVAASWAVTVLFRSDGTVVAFGNNEAGKLNIPPLPAGITYTQVATNVYHTVLLRSDGTAVAVGNNGTGALSIPQPPDGITYTQVAASAFHTVLLRSDGTAVAVGDNGDGQLNIPAPPAGITYTQVAAGVDHTVLLRSDGVAIAIGGNGDGQLNIPPLSAGVTYTRVAAGEYTTVLLRSDGTAVAVGSNGVGQLNIPQPPAGVVYTQVSASRFNTMLLSSTSAAPANMPPVAVNDTATVAEGGTTIITVIANDSDSDGTVDTATVVITRQPTTGSVIVNAGGTVTYVSNGTEVTTDSFSYRVNDDKGATSNEATVSITINPVNDAPVAVGDTATVAAGGTTTIALLTNDSDADNTIDPATVAIVTQPQAGTITVNPNGTVTYTSTGTTSTTDSFTYTVKDTTGTTSNTATVTITITAVNAPPVALNDAATVAEGGSTTITVTANDTDANGTVDVTTVVITRQPTSGTATVNANGTVTYANNGSEARTDSFTYTVKDAAGATSNVATVTMTVTPVNDAPVAVNDTAIVAEGGTTTITLVTNDTDADGTIDSTTVVIVRQPTAGTVTVGPNGTVTYANNGSQVTTDSFTYTVKDAAGSTSNVATVTITITPVNDAPTAVNDSYTVAANGTLTISAPGLLANDTDPDGDTLAISGAFTPRNGTLSDVFSGGGFTYRPNDGFAGTDTFRYTISDGTTTSEGIVTITVTADANNVAPVGNPDSYTVNEDTVLTVNGPGLLANDTDANGQPLTVVSIGTRPTRGSLDLNSDGSFTYTPGPNLNGTDTFSYKASDGAAETAFTTVTINVTAVEDVPVAANDTIPHAKDTVVAYSLLNRVSDGDGDALTATLVTSTQHGTLQFLASQFAFVYTPNAGYVGTDSFTYKVNDGKADSAIATVTLTVA